MPVHVPKYADLYSQLRSAIVNGEFPAGSFIPTENELMERYQVSKTTIRHAVRLLKEHNLVDVRQGSGTRVLPREQKTVTGSKYNNPGSQTSVCVQYNTPGKGIINNTNAVIDVIPAPESAETALKLTPGEPVYRLQRLQLADGTPFGYMVNYLPVRLVPDLRSKGTLATDLYGFLREHYGIAVSEAEETVNALTAGFMEAQYLQTEIGAPLLLLTRTAFSSDSPVEYCETIVRPDIFQMTLRILTPGTASGDIFSALPGKTAE